MQLLKEDRVNYACKADYSEGGEMHTIVRQILDKIR